MRFDDLDLRVGEMERGPLRRISDVPGVTVGHCTVSNERHQTGVTAVMPCADDPYENRLPCAGFVLNGFGKSLGLMQVEELGIVPERLQDLSETWHCWMTPMAADLELFFYGNGKSILVLPYLNGEAVTFSGLEQVHGPFYRWEDVGSRIRDILRRS